MLLSLALDPNYRFESIFNPEIIIKGIKMIKSVKAIIVISRRRGGELEGTEGLPNPLDPAAFLSTSHNSKHLIATAVFKAFQTSK